jgi:hypothetical protein
MMIDRFGIEDFKGRLVGFMALHRKRDHAV